MIEPFDPVDARKRPQPQDQWFKIVAWDDDLPAFDPLVMVKTVVLSPSSVKKFNQLALKFARVTEQSVICAIMLRSATFALPAELGRKVAPIAALLHLPGMIVFTAGFRTEYVKIILHTFDFWFLHATNTIWAVVFSIVLGDVRALLVVVCWGNFTNALLQETYLRNTNFIMMIMVLELVYYILLLLWLSLEFVDGLHHYTVTTARGQTLSTKDILVNVLGTLTMLLEWAPSCAVASLLLLVFTILTVDALTPTMKRRLHFKFWMPVVGIILFWMVEVVLLVDALVMGNWDLQDRVFLELIIFGRQAQFRVVSFFLSRILTIFVWSARYVNIALSRQNDNVLILLRGEVEFDYEGWKRQSRLGPGAKQTRQFCT
ncbi:hypothetical protein PF006_g21174 [Phytophthora fragariae]|uniref:Uncharacterized protein n=1 Tax=Phytophthora fragariae TaxID=53985 RepID=A0A6A3S0F7_9STRA|nr:hypothetical protein PF006_g21174 [Phytophthora fragariae]